MAHLDFETTFPAFSDLRTAQFYDVKQDADAALEAFKEAHLSETDPVAVAKFLSDLKNAILSLVLQIMPEEETTTRIDYTVDDLSGMRVSMEQQLARLQASGSKDEVTFRIANMTLEHTFQALLDHLTSARVAEEMDAPTYVERLRGGFKRVREGAASLKINLEEKLRAARTIHGRLEIVFELSTFVRAEIIPRLIATSASHAPLEVQAAALNSLNAKSCAFAEHFSRFLDISIKSLHGIEKQVCSDANIAAAEGESVLVSRELERHAVFRPLPILWALAIVLLVKIILAQNTSVTLHTLSIPILFLAFVLTWGLSIFIGVWMRTRRMRDLQRHIRTQFRLLMQDGREREELIEFPAIGTEKLAIDQVPVSAYPYRGKVVRHKWRVALRNLWALAIPVVLLAVVLISREDAEHQFVAQFEGAQPCILASGRLVFATRASYFVLPVEDTSGFWKETLARVFPELFAHMIPRKAVIGLTDDGHDLRACVNRDANRNSYTITHDGNALGQLGDTNLNVLAQAISGPAWSQSIINNPIIIDARRAIELELSKVDPADIRVDTILNALGVIRAEIGVDLTLAQTLGIAFGGLSMSDNGIQIPDILLSLFEGDNTLMSELSGMRVAFERSNDLAQTFISSFENETAFDNGVTVLSDRLGLLIAHQERLISVITEGLKTNVEGGTVVAPIIFDPTITGSSRQGVFNANIFQTSISLDGARVNPDIIANTLVLPFFPTPVTNGSGSLQTPQGAFEWGSDPLRLIDPQVLEDGTTYFARIAQTLDRCLAQDGTVTIDLLGLASRSWRGAAKSFSDAELNYHLAEGRRVGALRKIAAFIEAPSAHERILVERDQGGAIPLSQIIAAFENASIVAEFLPMFGRYDGLAGFEARRDTLLAVTGLNAEVASPLEELFGRSVVLRMVSVDDGPCQF